MADGLRGKPDVDLADYAAARGLEQRGQKVQMGYVAAFPMTEELQFNVLRGELPGGEHGVLYHEVKLYDESTTGGTFYGVRVGGEARLEDVLSLTGAIGEPERFFKCPHTTIGIRLPEAQGPIVGLDIGRDPERSIEAAPPGSGGMKVGFTINLGRKSKEPIASGPPAWVGYMMDAFGVPEWRVAYRGRAREEAVNELLGGPIRELLTLQLPLGFRVSFHYGTLVLTQQHFLKQAEELDWFASTASWLAGAMRQLCTRHAEFQPFDAQLPEPDWAAKVQELPDDTFLGVDNQDLAIPERIAAERAMATEDPFAFHRAFADLPVPGEAVGVLRGTLPGTSLTGRLVTAIEQPLRPPPAYWDRVLDMLPGGPFGCDSVLLPVRPDVPDQHGAVGERFGDPPGRFAVKRGILTAWRTRTSAQPDGAELDALTADAVRLAQEQGLLAGAVSGTA